MMISLNHRRVRRLKWKVDNGPRIKKIITKKNHLEQENIKPSLQVK